MTYTRRIVVPGQVQTAETDTTLRLGPDGTGGVAWTTGGGGGCDHQHVTTPFTAAGGSPETFTLPYVPLWDRRVFVQGARIWPADVGGSDVTVTVATSAADRVVVDYEAECGLSLAFPGEDVVLGGFHQNVLASFVTTGPEVVKITITETENSGGAFTANVAVMNATDDYTVYTDVGPNLGDSEVDPAIGSYLFRAPFADTWYIVGTYVAGASAYVSDLTGAGTYQRLTDPGAGTALSFPGANAGSQNQLATGTTSGRSILWITLASDLPASYYIGAVGDTTGDIFYQPALAATYPFILYDTENFEVYAYLAGVYDGGLTGSGTYQLVPA